MKLTILASMLSMLSLLLPWFQGLPWRWLITYGCAGRLGWLWTIRLIRVYQTLHSCDKIERGVVGGLHSSCPISGRSKNQPIQDQLILPYPQKLSRKMPGFNQIYPSWSMITTTYIKFEDQIYSMMGVRLSGLWGTWDWTALMDDIAVSVHVETFLAYEDSVAPRRIIKC